MDVERRQCTQCLEFFPATEDYFHWYDSRRKSLRSRCKACHWLNDHTNYRKRDRKTRNAKSRANYNVNRQHIADVQKKYRMRKVLEKVS